MNLIILDTLCSMFRHCLFPVGIVDFLSNHDTLELICSQRRFTHEIQPILQKRKRKLFEHVIHLFHESGSIGFRLHHLLIDQYCLNLKYLFRFIPEWFHYIENQHIQYLDLCVYYQGLSKFHDFFKEAPDEIITTFLYYLSINKTLTYCNLNIFMGILSMDRIYEAIKDHPTLTAVELMCSMGYLYQSEEILTLYRQSDHPRHWSKDPPKS